ncbi:methyltransferase [Sphingomonas morindae]|uniref:Methyltransferase domain-containing protein n=1 Tax=Sphingomonas morindae TaxID=1541170 RepID=A0ABY4X5I4_9SPHN|nr:methyltransferase [Sphingomonas morindae]USI72147.1 methyltransferase domain-containing protein [Sphingomonas morindae]
MSIAAAFDRAAGYDAAAEVQARVAGALATEIAGLALPPRPRVLEIGCGTGLLGAALIDRLPGASWRMTDIAPAMVARAQARFGRRPDIAYAVMDGEAPDPDGRYDLICSSLALQWFRDLPAGVARLRARLAPGGRLVFTTLAEGSFAEWRAAHHEASPGTPDYPAPAALAAMGLRVTLTEHRVHHPDGRAFVRALKAIGAGTPRPGHRPLAPAAFRATLARFEAAGAVARYVVATCMGEPSCA